MSYSTGYIRNPRRRELRLFSAHPSASTTSPAAYSLDQFSPGILDQGGTGSCTGHARAKGLCIARAAHGRPLGFVPSPADLYRITRCLERSDWSQPLRDNGADPVDTMTAAQKWGLRKMLPLADRFSDADPATINNDPKLDDLIADAELVVWGDHQIIELGSSRYALVMSAISQGYPVCFDVPGGWSGFQGYSSGVLMPDFSQPLDHYIECHEYRTDSAGRLILRIDNSWGTGWGLAGRADLDHGFLDMAGDVIVCAEAS